MHSRISSTCGLDSDASSVTQGETTAKQKEVALGLLHAGQVSLTAGDFIIFES
jgi:hypothetical protein